MVQPIQQQPYNLVEPPPVQQEYYGVPPVIPATRVSDDDEAFMSPPPVEPVEMDPHPIETFEAPMEPPVEDVSMKTQPIPPRSQTIDMDKDLRLENLTAQVKQLQDQLKAIPSIESRIARALAGGDLQVSSANKPVKRTAPESVPVGKRTKKDGQPMPTTSLEEEPPSEEPPRRQPVKRSTSAPPKPRQDDLPDFSNVVDPTYKSIAERYVQDAKTKRVPLPIKFTAQGEIVKRSILNKPYWKAMTRKLEKENANTSSDLG
jgi:hypothetical protein